MLEKQKLAESFSDYYEIANTRMERSKFVQDVNAFVAKKSTGITLTEAQLASLFEITNDFLRRDTALRELKRKNITSDWRSRRRLIENTKATFRNLKEDLTEDAGKPNWPLTAELATDLLKKLSNFETRLTRTFERIDLNQRSSTSMMRMLPLNHLRRDYIGELTNYLAGEFPSLKATHRNIFIAAAMEAGNLFTPAERRGGVLARIAMTVSRAKKHERELREDGVELARRQKSA